MPVSAARTFLRRLDLATLDLFVSVCETGSIAAAAARGNLAASAASKRIAELEAAAGVALLLRHARGARPTPAGEQALRAARAILFDVERLRGDLDECAEGVRGRVALWASASAVEQFLPVDIGDFRRANPDIRIDLRQGTSRAVADAVRNRDAEIGVCNPTEAASGLHCRAYRREALVMVTPPGHPLAAAHAVAYADTLEFEQIGLRGSSSVRETLAATARASRRPLRQGIEVESLSAMCRMIETGLGIGVMPEGAFRALAAGSGLAPVRLTDAWAERAVNLYAVDFAALSAAAQRFVAHLAPG